jgi:hypothetical protein
MALYGGAGNVTKRTLAGIQTKIAQATKADVYSITVSILVAEVGKTVTILDGNDSDRMVIPADRVDVYSVSFPQGAIFTAGVKVASDFAAAGSAHVTITSN